MSDQRKNIRYQTLAKAKLELIPEGEILLRDISVLGCRVECTVHAGINMHEQYKLEVIPEKISEIGSFDILVKSKWTREGNYTCEIGFEIAEFPKGRSFQRYVDYLSWRFAQGDSMSGNLEFP